MCVCSGAIQYRHLVVPSRPESCNTIHSPDIAVPIVRGTLDTELTKSPWSQSLGWAGLGRINNWRKRDPVYLPVVVQGGPVFCKLSCFKQYHQRITCFCG